MRASGCRRSSRRIRRRAAPILAEVAAAEPGDPVATLTRWIDEDRKATPLKTLQGMIWADGYREGAFTGHVYADAVAGLRRWHAAGTEALRLFVGIDRGAETAVRP